MEYGWMALAGTTLACGAAAAWYEKNHEKISKFIYWKVINRLYSGTLKGELKRINKELDKSSLEKKLQ